MAWQPPFDLKGIKRPKIRYKKVYKKLVQKQPLMDVWKIPSFRTEVAKSSERTIFASLESWYFATFEHKNCRFKKIWGKNQVHHVKVYTKLV